MTCFAVIKRCFKTLKIQHAIKLLVLNFYSNYNRLAWQKNLNTLENKIKLYGSMMLNFIYGRKQANFRQNYIAFFLNFKKYWLNMQKYVNRNIKNSYKYGNFFLGGGHNADILMHKISFLSTKFFNKYNT